ncbi:MAG: TIGR00153 family protein [Nitrospina sp.]|jgi:predicted phosphate transport protein (TIGR00153 family)|nr:TIGR00153 family protein [Nitrospina sp.]
MRTILSMFAKSPFKPLVNHIDIVNECVNLITPLFNSYKSNDYEEVEKIAKNISNFEHDADKIKDDIRQHLPKSIFLPVDKRDFMHLLSAQDDIADAVEDLAVLVRIKKVNVPDKLCQPLMELVDFVVILANNACSMIRELEDLLEASFGGAEAEKIEKMASDLGKAEYEADKKQFLLAQKLFSINDLSAADLFLLNELIKKLGGVADQSEKIGKTLRVFLSR